MAMIPVGYAFLESHYGLLLPKLGVDVYQDDAAEKGGVISYGAGKRKILPRHLKTPVGPFENMIAAIDYQGIRLHFFSAMFRKVSVDDLTQFIADAPNAKGRRVLWHLYEWLTGERLDLPDLKAGNYIDLFDSRYYFTLKNGEPDRRTRVRNNALGTPEFCPTVRKTPEVVAVADQDVYRNAIERVAALGNCANQEVIGRSLNYLYTKETRSSNEIEREAPDKRKLQRFLNALKNAGLFDLKKEKLIDVQNQIVDEAARADDYRKTEIYVGESRHRFSEVDDQIHYIGCPQAHVESTMRGLLSLHDRLMIDNAVPALVHATMVSFGEVYIRPFDDGNGRLHRYLLHDIMRQRVGDHKFIIPVSAAILKNQGRYDAVLESNSEPILAMLEYDREDDGSVVIKNDIMYLYRYPDFTDHVKFIYDMMADSIEEDLVSEIVLIGVYDRVKALMNDVADVPNPRLDTLTDILLSGGGKVSKRKRGQFTPYFSDETLTEIQQKASVLIGTARDEHNVDIITMMVGKSET